MRGRVLSGASEGVRVVVYGANGKEMHAAGVRGDGRFVVRGVADGVYVAEVIGSSRWEFAKIWVRVLGGRVVWTERRLDLFVRPGGLGDDVGGDGEEEGKEVVFEAYGEANYLKVPPPWRLLDLVRNKFVVFQVFAISFIVWFPQYIRALDKDLLEELTGEKEPDLGDPNKVVKALIGFDEHSANDVIPRV